MFGIGGGEFIFIILMVLMFFGSDKIPDLARTLGKGIAQLKNATNDIKGEISKGMENSGIDANALTGGITDEINKAKEGFTKMVNESSEHVAIQSELDQIRDNFAKMSKAEIAEANPEKPVIIPEKSEEAPTDEGPVKRES